MHVDPLGHHQVQRLATFVAANMRHLDAVWSQFVRELSDSFPAAAGLAPMGNKTKRYQLASAFSTIAKNLGNLSAISGELSRSGANLTRAGFTTQHVPAARAALMNALQSNCADDWNPQIARDCCDAFECVMGCMNLAAETKATHAPVRKAA